MKENILVADDEREIADLVALYLENEGYTVSKCYTAHDVLSRITTDDIDCAILDVVMPEIDGFALCRKIRESHTYPIIMLTSKVASSDKINGLSLGADDYVTKPFDPVELVARVKAQLRRYTKYNPAAAENDNLILLRGLTLDLNTRRCRLDDRLLDLTPTEFSILCVLCRNRGKAVNSEVLFHEIWGDEYYSKSTNPIPVHVRHLREKMNDSAEHPRYIQTVWGVGYKIEA